MLRRGLCLLTQRCGGAQLLCRPAVALVLQRTLVCRPRLPFEEVRFATEEEREAKTLDVDTGRTSRPSHSGEGTGAITEDQLLDFLQHHWMLPEPGRKSIRGRQSPRKRLRRLQRDIVKQWPATDDNRPGKVEPQILLDMLQLLAARGDLEVLQSRPLEPLAGIAFPDAEGELLTVKELRAAADRGEDGRSHGGERGSYVGERSGRSRGFGRGSSWRDDERGGYGYGGGYEGFSVRDRLDKIRGRRSQDGSTPYEAARDSDRWLGRGAGDESNATDGVEDYDGSPRGRGGYREDGHGRHGLRLGSYEPRSRQGVGRSRRGGSGRTGGSSRSGW